MVWLKRQDREGKGNITEKQEEIKNNLNGKEAIIRDKKVDLYSKRRVKYKFRPQIEKFSKKYNFTYNYN